MNGVRTPASEREGGKDGWGLALAVALLTSLVRPTLGVQGFTTAFVLLVLVLHGVSPFRHLLVDDSS